MLAISNNPGMDGKSVTIGIRVPEELRDALTALAKAERRKLSQYCMMVLLDHAEKARKTAPKKS